MPIHRLRVVDFDEPNSKTEDESTSLKKGKSSIKRLKQKYAFNIKADNKDVEKDERAGGDTSSITNNTLSKDTSTKISSSIRLKRRSSSGLSKIATRVNLKKRTREKSLTNDDCNNKSQKINGPNKDTFGLNFIFNKYSNHNLKQHDVTRNEKRCLKKDEKKPVMGHDTVKLMRSDLPRKNTTNEINHKKFKTIPVKDLFGFQNTQRSNDSCIYQMSCDYLNMDKCSALKKLQKGFRMKRCKQNSPMEISQPIRKYHQVKVLNSDSLEFKNNKGSSLFYNISGHPFSHPEASCQEQSHLATTKDENVCVSSSSLVPITKCCCDAACGYSKAVIAPIKKRAPCPYHDDLKKRSAPQSEPQSTMIDKYCKFKRAQPKNHTNYRRKLVSGLVESITNFHVTQSKQWSSKHCLKNTFLGFLVILWSPCLLAVILAWVVLCPARVISLLEKGNCKKSSMNTVAKKARRKYSAYGDSYECYQMHKSKDHANRKGFLTSVMSWSTRVANSFQSVFSGLTQNKKRAPKSTASSFLRALKHPNPKNKYHLYYEKNRGWVMKPQHRTVIQNMRCEVSQKQNETSSSNLKHKPGTKVTFQNIGCLCKTDKAHGLPPPLNSSSNCNQPNCPIKQQVNITQTHPNTSISKQAKADTSPSCINSQISAKTCHLNNIPLIYYNLPLITNYSIPLYGIANNFPWNAINQNRNEQNALNIAKSNKIQNGIYNTSKTITSNTIKPGFRSVDTNLRVDITGAETVKQKIRNNKSRRSYAVLANTTASVNTSDISHNRKRSCKKLRHNKATQSIFGFKNIGNKLSSNHRTKNILSPSIEKLLKGSFKNKDHITSLLFAKMIDQACDSDKLRQLKTSCKANDKVVENKRQIEKNAKCESSQVKEISTSETSTPICCHLDEREHVYCQTEDLLESDISLCSYLGKKFKHPNTEEQSKIKPYFRRDPELKKSDISYFDDKPKSCKSKELYKSEKTKQKICTSAKKISELCHSFLSESQEVSDISFKICPTFKRASKFCQTKKLQRCLLTKSQNTSDINRHKYCPYFEKKSKSIQTERPYKCMLSKAEGTSDGNLSKYNEYLDKLCKYSQTIGSLKLTKSQENSYSFCDMKKQSKYQLPSKASEIKELNKLLSFIIRKCNCIIHKVSQSAPLENDNRCICKSKIPSKLLQLIETIKETKIAINRSSALKNVENLSKRSQTRKLKLSDCSQIKNQLGSSSIKNPAKCQCESKKINRLFALLGAPKCICNSKDQHRLLSKIRNRCSCEKIKRRKLSTSKVSANKYHFTKELNRLLSLLKPTSPPSRICIYSDGKLTKKSDSILHLNSKNESNDLNAKIGNENKSSFYKTSSKLCKTEKNNNRKQGLYSKTALNKQVQTKLKSPTKASKCGCYTKEQKQSSSLEKSSKCSCYIKMQKQSQVKENVPSFINVSKCGCYDEELKKISSPRNTSGCGCFSKESKVSLRTVPKNYNIIKTKIPQKREKEEASKFSCCVNESQTASINDALKCDSCSKETMYQAQAKAMLQPCCAHKNLSPSCRRRKNINRSCFPQNSPSINELSLDMYNFEGNKSPLSSLILHNPYQTYKTSTPQSFDISKMFVYQTRPISPLLENVQNHLRRQSNTSSLLQRAQDYFKKINTSAAVEKSLDHDVKRKIKNISPLLKTAGNYFKKTKAIPKSSVKPQKNSLQKAKKIDPSTIQDIYQSDEVKTKSRSTSSLFQTTINNKGLFPSTSSDKSQKDAAKIKNENNSPIWKAAEKYFKGKKKSSTCVSLLKSHEDGNLINRKYASPSQKLAEKSHHKTIKINTSPSLEKEYNYSNKTKKINTNSSLEKMQRKEINTAPSLEKAYNYASKHMRTNTTPSLYKTQGIFFYKPSSLRKANTKNIGTGASLNKVRNYQSKMIHASGSLQELYKSHSLSKSISTTPSKLNISERPLGTQIGKTSKLPRRTRGTRISSSFERLFGTNKLRRAQKPTTSPCDGEISLRYPCLSCKNKKTKVSSRSRCKKKCNMKDKITSTSLRNATKCPCEVLKPKFCKVQYSNTAPSLEMSAKCTCGVIHTRLPTTPINFDNACPCVIMNRSAKSSLYKRFAKGLMQPRPKYPITQRPAAITPHYHCPHKKIIHCRHKTQLPTCPHMTQLHQCPHMQLPLPCQPAANQSNCPNVHDTQMSNQPKICLELPKPPMSSISTRTTIDNSKDLSSIPYASNCSIEEAGSITDKIANDSLRSYKYKPKNPRYSANQSAVPVQSSLKSLISPKGHIKQITSSVSQLSSDTISRNILKKKIEKQLQFKSNKKKIKQLDSTQSSSEFNSVDELHKCKLSDMLDTNTNLSCIFEKLVRRRSEMSERGINLHNVSSQPIITNLRAYGKNTLGLTENTTEPQNTLLNNYNINEVQPYINISKHLNLKKYRKLVKDRKSLEPFQLLKYFTRSTSPIKTFSPLIESRIKYSHKNKIQQTSFQGHRNKSDSSSYSSILNNLHHMPIISEVRDSLTDKHVVSPYKTLHRYRNSEFKEISPDFQNILGLTTPLKTESAKNIPVYSNKINDYMNPRIYYNHKIPYMSKDLGILQHYCCRKKSYSNKKLGLCHQSKTRLGMQPSSVCCGHRIPHSNKNCECYYPQVCYNRKIPHSKKANDRVQPSICCDHKSTYTNKALDALQPSVCRDKKLKHIQVPQSIHMKPCPIPNMCPYLPLKCKCRAKPHTICARFPEDILIHSPKTLRRFTKRHSKKIHKELGQLLPPFKPKISESKSKELLHSPIVKSKISRSSFPREEVTQPTPLVNSRMTRIPTKQPELPQPFSVKKSKLSRDGKLQQEKLKLSSEIKSKMTRASTIKQEIPSPPIEFQKSKLSITKQALPPPHAESKSKLSRVSRVEQELPSTHDPPNSDVHLPAAPIVQDKLQQSHSKTKMPLPQDTSVKQELPSVTSPIKLKSNTDQATVHDAAPSAPPPGKSKISKFLSKLLSQQAPRKPPKVSKKNSNQIPQKPSKISKVLSQQVPQKSSAKISKILSKVLSHRTPGQPSKISKILSKMLPQQPVVQVPEPVTIHQPSQTLMQQPPLLSTAVEPPPHQTPVLPDAVKIPQHQPPLPLTIVEPPKPPQRLHVNEPVEDSRKRIVAGEEKIKLSRQLTNHILKGPVSHEINVPMRFKRARKPPKLPKISEDKSPPPKVKLELDRKALKRIVKGNLDYIKLQKVIKEKQKHERNKFKQKQYIGYQIEDDENQSCWTQLKKGLEESEKEAWPNEIGCHHIYLNTMRTRPCFWVYNLCPAIYPYFLRIYSIHSTICRMLMMCISVCFWLPILVCCYCCAKSSFC